MYFKTELSATGSCRSTRKVASHKGMSAINLMHISFFFLNVFSIIPRSNLGPAHKLALFNGKPHEFLSGGEDG